MTHSLSLCGDQVRQQDHDRYLTCLFAPADKREALFALYAFNIEIGKTRDVVREVMMGRIRLQWWREAISELYAGKVREHPVLQAMQADFARLIREEDLQALIDAREFDLEDRPPADDAELKAYARAIGGGLMQMAARLLGVTEPALLSKAINTGEAVALTGLLRSVRHHALQHRTYLPATLLERVGIDTGFGTSGKPLGIEIVTEVIAKEAERLLDEGHAEVERDRIAAFLPGTITRHTLRRLRRIGYNPFDPQLDMLSGVKPFLLTAAWLTGKV